MSFKRPSEPELVTKAIAVLTDARRQNRSWKEVVRALVDLEKSSLLDEDGRPWIKRTEAISGYSANQLRRTVKTLAFLERIQESNPELGAKLAGRLPSHVEVISKIWASNAEKAAEIINETPPFSNFRALLAIHDKVKQANSRPVSAGKTAAKALREQCLIAIETTDNPIAIATGVDTRIVRPTLPFAYSNPDFLILRTIGRKVVSIEALDCYPFSGRDDYSSAQRKVVQLATESTFFSRFWVIVPDSAMAGWLSGFVRDLDLGNVIVSDLDIVHLPKDLRTFSPVPDRRKFWIAENSYNIPRVLASVSGQLTIS